ncbi:Beta-hexosaminidase [Streptomyces sp. RB5]|uniref:beta-N-acetylhexosaminidase n=1 Tax=Streptomyces smaragdinus TaxID=2585196 RepID=A0A7K0CMX9_9ACTN|nr:beta-N-acetylhexosaminidase [Streptomyces smaragdinus]MQY14134.1 Beta-hexosaminidase [Streptomyces smaragdinus]
MDLVPAPSDTSAAPGTGAFTIGATTTVEAAPGTESTARWLRTVLGAATGFALPPATPGDIRLALDPAAAPEAYRLDADATGIRITGGPAGVFWGAQTLRQLLGPEAYRRAPLAGTKLRAPHLTVTDAPRFGWRGVLLDVARHFLPKDGVLRYVDLLAAHKLNVLHLHLTDDQGWRVEIKSHPRLTEDGAWRARTQFGPHDSPYFDERRHGGYYTQDDLREIVAYAAERHITVVPEIDLPGHNEAAIAAYPELGNTDVVDTSAIGVRTTWGVSENVLAPTDEVLRFYEDVFDEVLELFPGPYIHIGGDECPKTQWRRSPAAQARIAELGLADEDELQSWFIRHFDRYLTERGRKLVGWDEILEGGLAEGATVASWRGYEGGIAAATAGNDVVMCPKQHVYLDYRQAEGEDEPWTLGHAQTLEAVYGFEPVPPELTGEAAGRVIGTQANLWAETMEDIRKIDFQAFPRLVAFAETAWSALPPPAERDFAEFRARLAGHLPRLDALGVEYRPLDGPRPWQQRAGIHRS